jgi:LysR family transcriptional regulator, transcriptional activator AphB
MLAGPRSDVELEIENLRGFLAVVEHSHLGTAATSLGIPPSTLTRRVQRLEADLGCLQAPRLELALVWHPVNEAIIRPFATALTRTTGGLTRPAASPTSRSAI